MKFDMIWGVVRTILAGVGGYFVSTGKVSGDTVTAIVGGLGTLAAGIWSVVSKAKT